MEDYEVEACVRRCAEAPPPLIRGGHGFESSLTDSAFLSNDAKEARTDAPLSEARVKIKPD